jgi:hypothetical protein
MVRLYRALQSADRALDCRRGLRILEIRTHGNQHVLRAKVHGQQFVHTDDTSLPLSQSPDACPDVRLNTFAGKQALALVGKETSGDRKQDSDDDRGNSGPLLAD